MKIIALALLAMLGVAAAQSARTDVKVSDAVPGYPGVTYETLLRQFISQIDETAGGGWITPGIAGFRTIDGLPVDESPFTINALHTLTLESGGRRVLVVLLAGEGDNGFTAPLAAYDISGSTVKLIDFVDAGMDRFTGLGTVVKLADGTDAITVTGEHGNSNEYFENVQVVMLQKEKLASVMYAGTYSLLVCGMEMKQAGELVTEPDAGKPYAALVYTVTQTVTRPEEECEDDGMGRLPAGLMTARDVFHWDDGTAKFVATSHDGDQLMGPE